MSYASTTDLQTLGLPAAFFAGALAPDITTQQAALDYATAFANSFVAVKVELPLTSPYDPTLVQATVAIASYTLMIRRGFNPENAADLALRQRYEDAVKWLERVAAGRAQLFCGGATPTPVAQPTAGVQPDVFQNEDRGFRNTSGTVGSGGWGF